MELSVRHCAVLMLDIAGSVRLHDRIGDAAAERQIRNLLDKIISASREHGGECVKSSGDDVMLVFEHDAVNSAVSTAIASHLLAERLGKIGRAHV